MSRRQETWKPENGNAPDADAEAVMGRVRARLENLPATEAGPEVPASLADPLPDLATLHATSDVQRPALGSHRKLFGPLILAVKRLLLRLLAPSLELQARHNAATTRQLTHCTLRLERLERQLEAALEDAPAPQPGDGRGPA